VIDDLVLPTYRDAFERTRTVGPEARAAVLRAMGLDAAPPPEDDGSVAVVRPGERLPRRGAVTLEDGTALGEIDRLPRDAPYGYHDLADDHDATTTIICGPGRCHLPTGLREWGWAIQLATLRSDRSWGIGDLDDLRRFAAHAASRGAGFVAVSPLGSPNPGPHPEPSPYYPSTRRFLSPLHLAVELLAGASQLPEVRDLAGQGRGLNGERIVDRSRVLALKTRALEAVWRAGVAREGFDAWRGAQDGALERWAVFATLTERLGPGWRSWPEGYRRADAPEVQRAARDEADRVAFHAWCQWHLERQLANASHEVRRIADMPVGVDPGGFDAWDWQEQLAIDATVGAPPDRFSREGQDWGLPPFVPHRLREAGYRPFVDTSRAQLRHAGGLRIDHVLGLFRLWWVPAGASPAGGAYVRSRTDELMEIVALESHRAGAVVIGEDLGTVPAGVRSELRRRRLLSTRLALFENGPPARYPRQSFAAVTTHDLPTIAGLWSGSDLADQRAVGQDPDHDAADGLRRRLVRAAALHGEPSAQELTLALHRRLAAAPPMLVAATLEDALGVEERPNLPGTTAEHRQNWSMALPVPLEQLTTDPRVAALEHALAEGR
jgi:4-alpha-glucanotransferase